MMPNLKSQELAVLESKVDPATSAGMIHWTSRGKYLAKPTPEALCSSNTGCSGRMFQSRWQDTQSLRTQPAEARPPPGRQQLAENLPQDRVGTLK